MMSLSESAFFFESDQLAFKGNEDYQLVLSSLAKFEAIRAKALTDLDKLHDLKRESLANPLEFVNKLQHDPKALNIPSRPKIPDVPSIDWSTYSYSASDSSSLLHNTRTRKKKVNVPQELLQKRPVKSTELTDDATIIRGRVKADHKPESFNQLWTSEEQRRLEELLIEFPPERVEARRYRKIVDKIGTKTLQQVASRIQKYFIRLAQCGLPIPGRVPNLAAKKKKSRHRHHLRNKPAMPSTFLQAYVPPVFMAEDHGVDGVSSIHSSGDSDSDDSSESDFDLSENLKDTDEYRELMEMKNLRQIKLNSGTADHIGYKCDGCGVEPIVGVRYHCLDCPSESSIDFCSICNSKRITLATHRPEHNMSAVKDATNEVREKNMLSGSPGHSSASKVGNDQDYLPRTCKQDRCDKYTQ